MTVPVSGHDDSEPRNKLRMLCLHGYEQDSNVLRTKLKHHMAALQNKVDFVFETAPNILHPYDIDGMDNVTRAEATRTGKTLGKTFRGWYFLKSADPEIIDGLENSIEHLVAVLEEQGPFDGMLGFSQGGLMTAIMCSLLEHRYKQLGDQCTHAPFKFAIISSGYKLKDTRWQYLYEKPISTPSLHIYGVLDSMIHVSKSIELKHTFAHATEYCFVGTHFVPKTPEAIETISEFIAKFTNADE
ncbi:hypothetical protein GGI25_005259 [Coemansia spiralis]|uniref:Serine hydrolase domain-containing protein n=2 Tax=Coemansia TaxID=4863 RepID=A0A9W8KUU9_9FUNG|nr:serine hydrolase FSH [Coemansia spiralis]KAJ1987016.1 hypothetical protein EDC05_006041 [Coemansia umbellata]KAJ2619016.1 hypothetical protein GGI26_006172 [Coemansia sp. RSA 1358]KAJ2672065.1 hypothetical protein GGI25_005259 [Coemansia spiralis]